MTMQAIFDTPSDTVADTLSLKALAIKCLDRQKPIHPPIQQPIHHEIQQNLIFEDKKGSFGEFRNNNLSSGVGQIFYNAFHFALAGYTTKAKFIEELEKYPHLVPCPAANWWWKYRTGCARCKEHKNCIMAGVKHENYC